MPTERAETAAVRRDRETGSPQAKAEYPVREYIGAMAVELAQMARWDGDEALVRILDSAAALAAERIQRAPVELEEPRRARPA